MSFASQTQSSRLVKGNQRFFVIYQNKKDHHLDNLCDGLFCFDMSVSQSLIAAVRAAIKLRR